MMKNSKKKGILIAVAVAVIVVIAVAAVCLNRKTDNAGAVSEGRTESADKTKKSDKADKEESENKRNSDAQVITFAIPDISYSERGNTTAILAPYSTGPDLPKDGVSGLTA